jgi:hypothetical protein
MNLTEEQKEGLFAKYIEKLKKNEDLALPDGQ